MKISIGKKEHSSNLSSLQHQARQIFDRARITLLSALPGNTFPEAFRAHKYWFSVWGDCISVFLGCKPFDLNFCVYLNSDNFVQNLENL